MYPGLIDMDNSAPLEGSDAPPAAGGGGRGGGGGGATTFATLEEAERAKRTAILRPNYMAADNLRPGTPALQALASAGVTFVPGILLLLIVLFIPNGLVGWLRQHIRRARGWLP